MEFEDVKNFEKIEDVPEEYRPYVQGVVENNKLLYGEIYFRNAEGKRKQKQYATGLKPRGNRKLAREITEQHLKDHWREYIFIPKMPKPESASSEKYYFLTEYERWIDLREKCGKVVPNTIKTYRSFYRKHLKSFFNKNPELKNVNSSALLDFFNSRTSSDSKRKISKNTLSHFYTYLNTFFKEMIVRDKIKDNPLTKIEKPKAEDYEPPILSDSDVYQIISSFAKTDIEIAVIIASQTGLRRSEILGLRWSAIDLESGKTKINHTVHYENNQIICIDRTKSKKGKRTIYLTKALREYLVEAKKQQDRRRELFGNCYNHKYDDYVCVDVDGTILNPDHVSKKFSKFMKKIGLSDVHLHLLRHYFASYCASRNIPPAKLQKWMGHEAFRTTYKYYIHLSEEEMEDVSESIDIPLKLNQDQINPATT